MREISLAAPCDLDKLLSPISDAHPTGTSLRYEGTYDRIQEARSEDDPLLPQGVWQKDLKKANWDVVQNECLEALENHTKDLHLAVWLLEAWLHLYGFVGVKEGLYLITKLCKHFWDHLYPAPEGEDLEARISPITWMNEKLSFKLKQIPITQPQTGDVASYCWAQWESACYLENMAKKDAHLMSSAEAEGQVTRAKFLESVMLSPAALYSALAKELQGTIDAAVALGDFLDDKCGANSPGLGQFRETLVAIHRFVRDVLRDREAEVGGEVFFLADDTTLDIVTQDDVSDSGYVSGGGPIRSRAEAYRRLSEAADYLLRTEPHSPTPYLVKRAVSWGGMTLTELLQEIVRDNKDLLEIYALLGVVKEGGKA